MQLNNLLRSLQNSGSAMLSLNIAAIILLVLFCFYLTILTFQIRKQVNRLNARIERIMAALKIPEQGKTGQKAKAAKTKKGLQLDDNDIRKLKKIGVGMDES
jgi:cell division protein FtsL